MTTPGQPVPLRGPRVIVRKAAPVKSAGIGPRAKKALLWLAGLAAAGACAWGVVWYLQPAPPDPASSSAKEIATYLLSDKFAKLSDVKKEDYAEGITKLPDDRQREIRQVEGLTDQDKRTLGRNLSQGWMRQRMQEMKDFFKLSAEERLAALDKAIADMDARRGMRGAGGPNAPAGGQPPAAGTGPTGGPPGGRRPRSADRMQQGMEQRLSNTTPEDRAVSYEYRRLLQERRRQLQAAGR